MGSTLRLSLAVSALVAACSTQGSGLDSESHFACNSDADCAVHSGRTVCVEHVCEPPDASMSETGGKAATGGGVSMNTGGGVNMSGGSGGAAGHGNTGTGGRSSMMPDARAPRDAGRDTRPPAPDVGICQKCTKDLTPEQSLDCYCRSNSCDAELASALANPTWQRVDEGCGLIVVSFVRNLGLGSFGAVETFDRSGRLIGAISVSDEGGFPCILPQAAGGNYENQCTSTKSCTLKGGADGGADRCDLDALLSETGTDAGPPCQSGEIRASVCTSCLTGCGRRELKCVKTCATTDDCTAAHVTGTCVDSICQEFCPF